MLTNDQRHYLSALGLKAEKEEQILTHESDSLSGGASKESPAGTEFCSIHFGGKRFECSVFSRACKTKS